MNTERLSNELVISVIAHFVLAILFFVRAALFPSEVLDLKNAIRVDMVDLPDKLPQTAPEPVAAPAPAPVETKIQPEQKVIEKPKPENKVVLEKKDDKKKLAEKAKTDQKKALEKLKALSAIDRLKSEVQERNKPKPQTFKGNTLNEGDGLTGLERIEYDRYFSSLKSQVMKNWRLPGWLAQASLRAQAVVMINDEGRVLKREIVKSSGNDVFDAQVIESIDRSEPFLPPPDRLKSILSLKGIVFNFPE